MEIDGITSLQCKKLLLINRVIYKTTAILNLLTILGRLFTKTMSLYTKMEDLSTKKQVLLTKVDNPKNKMRKRLDQPQA